jgi:ArsR family metal-binding transcriptional regulator
MTRALTTFARVQELEKAKHAFETLGLPYDVVGAAPAYAAVGVCCVIVDDEARMALAQAGLDESFVCSGWVPYRGPGAAVPPNQPATYPEDVFGTAAVMVVAPCVADPARIRITAHISGDLGKALPYLNTEMIGGSFAPTGPTFTFMDQQRMVCLHPRRIAVAKADDVVDAWRVLEGVRNRVNGVWARRHAIVPSYERRERPPAIEIYKRLPRTNCGECGEATCLAFAGKLWRGSTTALCCRPIFGGDHAHKREALLEICAGLGVADGA